MNAHISVPRCGPADFGGLAFRTRGGSPSQQLTYALEHAPNARAAAEAFYAVRRAFATWAATGAVTSIQRFGSTANLNIHPACSGARWGRKLPLPVDSKNWTFLAGFCAAT